MTGVTTGQTSLATATDSDDTEAFLTGPLTTDLQALANLFESATGHDHSGAGKGKPITAAGLDAAVGNFGVWAAFTPTLTQGVALTLSTAVGRYMQVGKTVIASVEIIINSAGTAAQVLTLGGLPVAARAPSIGPTVLGSGWYWDNTPDAVYTLAIIRSGTNGATFASGSGGASSGFGVAPAVTAAATDRLMLNFSYEAA